MARRKRSTSTRRASSGRQSVPYVDYSEPYVDYSYADTYPDGGGYQDFAIADRLKFIEKLVILEGDNSYLLADDPDIGSSLFEGLKKDANGRLTGVLPRLLHNGWAIKRVMPADAAGRSMVVIRRPAAKARG
jgi:hypothetical protein